MNVFWGKLDLDVIEKYQVLSIELLIPNTWNPNHINPWDFESLKRALEETGGNIDQPVMVRPHPEKEGMYEIVDWFHRYTAMKDLGFEEIVVVVKELDDRNARLKTIAMNKFRWDFDSLELAGLIKELKQIYKMTDEEINKELGYSKEEISGYESLIDFDFEQYKQEDWISVSEDKDILDIESDIILRVTDKQRVNIEKLKELTNNQNLSEAISIVARYYAILEETGQIDQSIYKEAMEDNIV